MAGIAALLFDSSQFAPDERAERQLAASAGIWDIIETSALFEARLWPLEGLILNHIVDHGARAQARTAMAVRRDQLDLYRVRYQISGEMQWESDGLRRVVRPGQILFTDFARTESFSFERAAGVYLAVPRDALDSVLPRPLDLHGWMPQGALAMVLANHLCSLMQAMPIMTTQELPSINYATLQLIAAVIAPSAGTLGGARPVIERALLREAQRYIQAHLTDPDLSIDKLCGALKVSRATLYRLFAEEGGIALHIREQRLRRAHLLLASAQQRLTMERLADQLGFSSAAQFSRAFRAHFGYVPSDVGKLGLAYQGMPLAGSGAASGPADPLLSRMGLRFAAAA